MDMITVGVDYGDLQWGSTEVGLSEASLGLTIHQSHRWLREREMIAVPMDEANDWM